MWGTYFPRQTKMLSRFKNEETFQDVAWMVEVSQLGGGQVRQRRGGGQRRHPAAQEENWGEIRVWQIHRWVQLIQSQVGIVLMRLCLQCLSNDGLESWNLLPSLYHCSPAQRGVILSYSSGLEYQGYMMGPGVVMMRGPQSPASRPGQLVTADTPQSTLSTGPSLALHPWPGHWEPVRQCQSSPDSITVVNFIIDPSTDKILRSTEYKLSVKLDCQWNIIETFADF